jgi:hypothetical protein
MRANCARISSVVGETLVASVGTSISKALIRKGRKA